MLQRGRAPESAESWDDPEKVVAAIELQRGRAPESAESTGAVAAPPDFWELQRGRAPESAESTIIPGAVLATSFASTGPRSGERGVVRV